MRWLRLLAALTLSSQLTAAQTTGMIAGTARDSAGGPIPNAQVFIIGTAFTALTDALGAYLLEGVPQGRHDLRAAFVGYRPALLRNVSVGADTTRLDWTLASGPMVIGCTLGVLALPPLVPRDHNTTRWTMSRELLANEPLR